MTQNNHIKIHTRAPVSEPSAPQKKRPVLTFPHLSPGKVLPKRSRLPLRKAARSEAGGSRLTFGERLIRNSAVACALLLSLMAARNIDRPWSNRLTQSIRSAVTMQIDWDEGLGKLRFVRALMPDAALVFLNLSDGEGLKTPVEGTLAHSFSEDQPWLEYRCETGSPVLAAQSGTITAAGQGAGGDWIILVQHEEGESMYGYLTSAALQVGQEVEKGGVLGQSSERLYFEWREAGSSVDPSQRLN